MAYWWNQKEVTSKSSKSWRFNVEYNATPGEVLYITGNCETLGHWTSEYALALNNGSSNEWSLECKIPSDIDVLYRYFVGKPVGNKKTVRKWESGMHPRCISTEDVSNVKSNASSHRDVFGQYNNITAVEKGWLTGETSVQFRLNKQPIQLWKNQPEQNISVKVTALSLYSENATTRPTTEISVLKEHEQEFHLQQQFGQLCSNEFLVFQTFTDTFESTAYLIDLYAEHNPANFTPLGFSYILPSVLTRSEGESIVPIQSHVDKGIIGQITLNYLVVTPLDSKSDMKITFSSEWKESRLGLDVGHRGAGESFSGSGSASVRENTIASFRSAGEAGADLVEFDVQLSKDLIPILYHDFHVALRTERKLETASTSSEVLNDVIKIPVKDLTLDEMERLNLYHVKEGAAKLKRRFSKDLEMDHQAFPTLQRALELIDPSVGFNIELKWTMVRADGSYELEHPIDMNIFVDTILKVVLEYAGSRNCVFSCFHPDIVTLLRLKQNKYPVVFLTQGVTSKWSQYKDPRCHNVSMGIHHALSASLLGLSVHAEDLLRDESQVKQIKDAGLMVWTWGDDANNPSNVARLKQLGVQAIINDRVVAHSRKTESVFLIEAKEAAKHLDQ